MFICVCRRILRWESSSCLPLWAGLVLQFFILFLSPSTFQISDLLLFQPCHPATMWPLPTTAMLPPDLASDRKISTPQYKKKAQQQQRKRWKKSVATMGVAWVANRSATLWPNHASPTLTSKTQTQLNSTTTTKLHKEAIPLWVPSYVTPVNPPLPPSTVARTPPSFVR